MKPKASGPKWPITIFGQWPVTGLVYFEDATGAVWHQTGSGHPVRMSGTKAEVSEQIKAGRWRGELVPDRKRNPNARRSAKRKGKPRKGPRVKARVSYDTRPARRPRTVTTKTVSVRKINPVIMAKSRHLKNPIVRYYAGGRRFARKLANAKIFGTKERAKGVALDLLSKWPKLRKWDVYIREGK